MTGETSNPSIQRLPSPEATAYSKQEARVDVGLDARIELAVDSDADAEKTLEVASGTTWFHARTTESCRLTPIK